MTFCSRERSLCGKLSGVSNVVTTCKISSKITKVVLLPPSGCFSCGRDYRCPGSAAPPTWHADFAKRLVLCNLLEKALLSSWEPQNLLGMINRSMGMNSSVESCYSQEKRWQVAPSLLLLDLINQELVKCSKVRSWLSDCKMNNAKGKNPSPFFQGLCEM